MIELAHMVRWCIAALVAVSAFAQSPRIDSVSPSQGPILGGTQVFVRGANFGSATVTLDKAPLVPSSSASDEIRFVTPKHDNGYAILRDLRNVGDKVWERFNASADDILAYYQSLVRSYREAGGGRLVDELDRIVRAIEREMGY